MKNDTDIIALRQPKSVDEPLTEIARDGARRMLAAALRAEADAFVAQHAEEVLPDGRQRVVRHGYGPERRIQTGIGELDVRRPKVRDTSAPQAWHAASKASISLAQCSFEAVSVSWSKAVRSAAVTMGLSFLPTQASALRIKWTRQRWTVAPSTFAAAAFSPLWSSAMIRRVPRSPRSARERKNSSQKTSASLG